MRVVFTHPLPTRREAYAACLVGLAAALGCSVLLAAAVLTPAPAAVLPLVAAVCIGCPMAFGWSLPPSIAVLRATRSLRRHLDRLPETPHPLGL